jgi:hypothetical protein
MTIDLAIEFFRQEELALMNSTGTVVRDDGEPTFNSSTGEYSQPVTQVYSGVVLIRMNAWQGSDVAVADTEVRLRPWRLKFPHGTSLLKDDRFTCVTSDNGALVDRVFRITDFYGDDWSPSAPYFAEEVT